MSVNNGCGLCPIKPDKKVQFCPHTDKETLEEKRIREKQLEIDHLNYKLWAARQIYNRNVHNLVGTPGVGIYSRYEIPFSERFKDDSKVGPSYNPLQQLRNAVETPTKEENKCARGDEPQVKCGFVPKPDRCSESEDYNPYEAHNKCQKQNCPAIFAKKKPCLVADESLSLSPTLHQINDVTSFYIPAKTPAYFSVLPPILPDEPLLVEDRLDTDISLLLPPHHIGPAYHSHEMTFPWKFKKVHELFRTFAFNRQVNMFAITYPQLSYEINPTFSLPVPIHGRFGDIDAHFYDAYAEIPSYTLKIPKCDDDPKYVKFKGLDDVHCFRWDIVQNEEADWLLLPCFDGQFRLSKDRYGRWFLNDTFPKKPGKRCKTCCNML